MKPILGSLGANTLVILTANESQLLRAAVESWCKEVESDNALRALNAGIARGTAHLEAEFKGLQEAKKRGR